MHDGSIATARTDHRVTDAVLDEQGSQDIDISFITIHNNNIYYN